MSLVEKNIPIISCFYFRIWGIWSAVGEEKDWWPPGPAGLQAPPQAPPLVTGPGQPRSGWRRPPEWPWPALPGPSLRAPWWPHCRREAQCPPADIELRGRRISVHETYAVLSVGLIVGNFVLVGQIFHEGEPRRWCWGVSQYLRLLLYCRQSRPLPL